MPQRRGSVLGIQSKAIMNTSITKTKSLNRVQGTLLYTGTIYIQADNLCFILFGSFSTHYTCPNINYQLLMTGIACGVSLFVNQKIVSVSSHTYDATNHKWSSLFNTGCTTQMFSA